MSGRKKLIAGNWKMNKTAAETVTFFKALSSKLPSEYASHVDVLICPPFTALSEASKHLPLNVYLGAQNVHFEKNGAFTGEISIEMLKEWNVNYVIIGHSERRQYFCESNTALKRKAMGILQEGLLPILCIGESLQERKDNLTLKILEKQLSEVLQPVGALEFEKLVIAYEPIWAIGTGETATPAMAQEVHGFIREWLKKQFGENTAKMIRILYGGSMNPGNAHELLKQPDIDGGLIGGASLKPESFIELVQQAANGSKK